MRTYSADSASLDGVLRTVEIELQVARNRPSSTISRDKEAERAQHGRASKSREMHRKKRRRRRSWPSK